MSSEPYLVAHLVRGKPAFDIAIPFECSVCNGTIIKEIGLHIGEPCDCLAGYCWIIPTSGHRAYPYWQIDLRDLRFYEGSVGYCDDGYRHIEPTDPPNPWPDHYSVNDNAIAKALDEIVSEGSAKAGKGKITADDLLARLNLARPTTPIKRRI